MNYLNLLEQPENMMTQMPRNESKNSLAKFPLYFHLYLKNGHFSTYLNFDEKYCFNYFESQISKCPIYTKILPQNFS